MQFFGRRRPSAVAEAQGSVGDRLRTWWSGTEPPAHTVHRRPPASKRQRDEEDPTPAGYWTAETIEVAQRVWGSDHAGPTDESYVRRVLKPLAIDSSMTIIELGSGLGGGARAVARDYGAWVTGYEPDAALAGAGMDLSTRSALGKKAPIYQLDPQKSPLRKGHFDRVIIRDLLTRIGNPSAILDAVHGSMKPKAQLLLTDFVLAERGGADERVQAWMQSAPLETPPMTASSLLGALRRQKFQIHVAEDESPEIERIVTARWDRMRATLEPAGVSPALVEPILREGVRWQSCVQALCSGGLRYYRIVASR